MMQSHTGEALVVYCPANETKQHNPIMSHSQADCVTNGVGDVMECVVTTPSQHPCLHFVKATYYGAHCRHRAQM